MSTLIFLGLSVVSVIAVGLVGKLMGTTGTLFPFPTDNSTAIEFWYLLAPLPHTLTTVVLAALYCRAWSRGGSLQDTVNVVATYTLLLSLTAAGLCYLISVLNSLVPHAGRPNWGFLKEVVSWGINWLTHIGLAMAVAPIVLITKRSKN